MVDFTPWLKLQQQRVEALLAARLERLRVSAPRRLADAMAYSLLDGGKRLRPVLCLALADASRSQSAAAGALAEDAAWALECVHTYSLIHDDLPAMDDDSLRRGRPTSHVAHGEAVAILAGDALLTDAFTILASGPEPVRAQLCAELAVAAGSGGMVGGQVLDIADDRPAELSYLLKLHGGKTGALIRAACRMGVISAQGSAAQLAAATTYGDAIGLAFQVADDDLDVTASAEVMGKPTGADAAAGRHTFPAVVGLDRAKAMANELVAQAVTAIAPLEGNAGPLAALARYTVERTH